MSPTDSQTPAATIAGQDRPPQTGSASLPLEEFLAGLAPLSAEERAPLLWDDQRRRWLAGQRATVEMYAALLNPPAADDLLLDLIYGEFVLRDELGEKPIVQEYRSRFPHLAQSIARQLSLHQAFSQDDADTPGDKYTTATGTVGSTMRRVGSSGIPPGSPADVPAEIAGYKIVALLDSGGQGVVYRAVHPTLGRDVIVKLGRKPVKANSAAIDAVIQEGRILAELDDPGLARVYDLRIHDGCPCLVMEYIRGCNLEQDAGAVPRDPTASAALVARVARALAASHRRGVLHRDIKPRNILIDQDGNPRLIDFGLARLEDAWRTPPEGGGLAGTVGYMPPEQARGEPPAPQSDLFALGGVLYFLLTGEAPYLGSSFTEVLARAQRGEWNRALLVDRKVPTRLRAILERAMATEPTARYVSAEELARDLERFSQPPRHHWLLVSAVALVVLIAALGIWQFLKPTPQPLAQPPVQPVAANPPAPEAKKYPFSMQIRVGRGKLNGELADLVPVEKGDVFRIETVCPANMHATLFVRTSSGKLEALTSVAPAEEERPVAYPESLKKGSRLTGPAGNELILLCARTSSPIGAEEVQKLLVNCSTWPMLPGDSVLGLSPAGAKAIQKSRDLGSLVDRADPEGEVQNGLQELQRRLRPHFDHFEGIVFSHKE
jgi:tRNA A-37 threonylcarbamoyl transferase component Bud32